MQSLIIIIFSQKLYIWLTASASIIQMTACTIQGWLYTICGIYCNNDGSTTNVLKNQIKITVQKFCCCATTQYLHKYVHMRKFSL